VLYQPEGFEPLTSEPWVEEDIGEAIRAIVADTDAAFDVDSLWPANEWDAWQMPVPLTELYCGAAGVIWALGSLGRRGHAESRIDLAKAALRTLEHWREEPDGMGGMIELPPEHEAALLAGESGILTVAWQLEPDSLLADRLHVRVRENLSNETNEVMWGIPGTLLAAHALLEATSEERWAKAWRESADVLLARRQTDGLWTQHLNGKTDRGLGPAHGLVGCVQAVLQGRGLLPDAQIEALERETNQVLARTAVLEAGLANWPTSDGRDLLLRDGRIRLQWCHGAPGIVIAAGSYLDEDLLLAAAELIWRAGPHHLERGPGICHGTAGNGYALLKTFERTGDELWLLRARRYCVHALEQVERLRAKRGRGRYSLLTGDLGVALFAASCLEARAEYPILDGWD
jgi:lantibiotic modifying enzyme